MSGYYPPGCTGMEPEIIGDGLEDKCEACLDAADGETPLDGIADAIIEVGGKHRCADCLRDWLEREGVDVAQMLRPDDPQQKIIDLEAKVDWLRGLSDKKQEIIAGLLRGLDDLKARRGCGMAFDQLLNERKISDLLERASNDHVESEETRRKL